MGKINWGRVVLGGLLAGLVLNVIDWVVYGKVLAADFNAALQALGKGPMTGSMIIWFVIFDFLFGIFLVWFYAAIRPRSGPVRGPRYSPASRSGCCTGCSTPSARRLWGCSRSGSR